MEQRLETAPWLVADHPTIADIACYPYVFLAGEGDFSLEPFASVRAWLKRLERIAGWIQMFN